MQFKVPQNIDMEDRIIGPLTLSQFFYLLFGGLIIYILFGRLYAAGLGFFFWILAIPIGLLSFAMAFLRVNDRPFPSFFVALIKFFTQPRQRTWQHYAPPAKPKAPTSKAGPQQKLPKKKFDALKASELAEVLDRPASK